MVEGTDPKNSGFGLSDDERPDEQRRGWELVQADMTLVVLQRKWTLSVLAALWAQDLRFQHLKAGLRLSPKVLTESLRGLERDGIITRSVVAGAPGIVYTVTPLGRSLESVLSALTEWAVEHHGDLRAARVGTAGHLEVPEPRVTWR